MDERTERLAAQLPDRYEIVREHGRGGMAVVYLAIDRKHDRQVALKVLAPELATEIGAERFVREIQIAARLNHPHIVPLLDSGVLDDLPFYVMPFVEGESLRDRLARDPPLSLAEALGIARDVAEALVCAHEHDLIHRDIKPANILLTDGGAVVTDFGIAAVVDRLPEDQLTRTGLSIGTAGYMSPEQASGERNLDGRTDQYSLGCVLFEMLAGRPPFTGRNARAILSRQLTEPAPTLSSLRDDTPGELDDCIGRALAADPGDRFPTSREFCGALEDLAHRAATGTTLRFRTRPAIWAALAAAVFLAMFPWLFPGLTRRQTSSAAAIEPDTTRYAVFPFEHEAGVDQEVLETLFLGDALAHWNGISTVPAGQVGEALRRTGSSPLNSEEAARVARELGAGRFITGGISRLSDSLRVEALLLEAGADSARVVGYHSVRISAALEHADSAFLELAQNLLWRGDPPRYARVGVGSSSLPALKSFEQGMRAVEKWDLPRAESGFSMAVEWDPEYAQANLWTALVRAWNDQEPASWQIPAHQAELQSEHLAPRDAAMAKAITLQAEGELEAACSTWRQVSREYPSDFASWYGLAGCLRSDRTVIRSSESPSDWRFRSSQAETLAAYRRAFQRLPSILQTLRADAYRPLRDLLLISGLSVRTGYSSGRDSSVFYAFPAWDGDSLAYYPRRGLAAFGPVPATELAQRWEALRQQRRVFRDVATNWVASAARSGPAHEALAISMALDDRDPAALDTLRRARELAAEPDDARRMAGLHVWLQLAYSLPGNEAGIVEARDRADSLLATDVATEDPWLASSLAVLVGRGLEAARLMREHPPSAVDPRQVPPPLNEPAAALLLFSALGGPSDSLDHLTGQLVTGVRGLSSAARDPAYRWLGLPASMAFAEHPLPGMEAFSADAVVGAQLALIRGDSAAARRTVATDREQGRSRPPFAVSFDAVRPLADLWVALGDARTAVAVLDEPLRVLPAIAPDILYEPHEMASLLVAAGRRAELARTLGSMAEAAAWSRAVGLLWTNADPFLQPLLRRYQGIPEVSFRAGAPAHPDSSG